MCPTWMLRHELMVDFCMRTALAKRFQSEPQVLSQSLAEELGQTAWQPFEPMSEQLPVWPEMEAKS